uniref:EamA domain-containing protein n=1 Tax=Brassica oleracea var. oleracea TaxID=109376 RepID=A0A0D3E7R3_BRAOL
MNQALMLFLVFLHVTVSSIGTTLNYFLDDKINRAEVLFPGVGCFLIAVFLGAAVHYSNATDVKAKLESLPSEYKAGIHREGDFYSSIKKGEDNPEKEETDLESHEQPVEKAKAGTAGFFVELENKRAIKFMGSQAAGYAAADSVQALPLVSTFWGIILFGEYWRSSRRTYVLLVSMLLMFVAAVAILMASSGRRGHRK